MRVGQPPVSQSFKPGAVARGGWQRPVSLGSYSDRIPVCMGNPRTDWMMRTASEPGLNGRSLPYPRGKISGPDAWAAPEIRPNYLSTAGDRIIAARSIRHARRLMQTRAISQFAPKEMLPGFEFQSDDELIQRAGDIATTIFHPVGTCRMGSDDNAVVDPELRLRGVLGLRVVDASVMPTIVSGNTNSPAIMIAEKAADMIAN